MEKEKLIAHLDGFKNIPAVKKSLYDQMGVRREIDKFYGIYSYERAIPRAGIVTQFSFEEPSMEHLGKAPWELVELVAPFAEKKIEKERLICEDVLEDYRRWHNIGRNLTRTSLGVTLFFGSALGGVASLGGFLSKHPYIGIAGAAGAVALQVLNMRLMMSDFPVPRNTNYSWREYIKLQRSACKAGYFIKNEYNRVLLERALGEK